MPAGNTARDSGASGGAAVAADLSTRWLPQVQTQLAEAAASKQAVDPSKLVSRYSPSRARSKQRAEVQTRRALVGGGCF